MTACWFASEGVAVHVGAEVDFRPLAKAHPALLVQDLAEAGEALACAGVAIEDDSGLAVRHCYVRGPFGNRLEFVDARDAEFSASAESRLPGRRAAVQLAQGGQRWRLAVIPVRVVDSPRSSHIDITRLLRSESRPARPNPTLR